MLSLFNSGCVNLSNNQKWGVSAYVAVLFFIIASPFLFMMVNKLTAPIGLHVVDARGCPNLVGLVVHALVFLLLVRLSLMSFGKNQPTPTPNTSAPATKKPNTSVPASN
jgi:hypothetical protein